MKPQNLEQAITSARRAIANYESNISMFESGELKPGVGELYANQLLLKRAKRQLSLFLGQRAMKIAHCTILAA